MTETENANKVQSVETGKADGAFNMIDGKEGKERADGEFAAQEEKKEEKKGKQGHFGAQENKEEEEKRPEYFPLPLNGSNISELFCNWLTGDLADYFINNMDFAAYFIDKGLKRGVEFRDSIKQKCARKRTQRAKNKRANQQTPNKNQKKSGTKEQRDAQKKATKLRAKEADAKKDIAKRKYPNTPDGKNQQAFDQMKIGAMSREAAFYEKMAQNPSYKNSPQAQKEAQGIRDDKQALEAMKKQGAKDKTARRKAQAKAAAKNAVDGTKNAAKNAAKGVKNMLKDVGKYKQTAKSKINDCKKRINKLTPSKAALKKRVKMFQSARDNLLQAARGVGMSKNRQQANNRGMQLPQRRSERDA